MNTKSLLARIGVPVLSLGLLGGVGATLATSASAATLPGTVTAVTHLNNHPDTTTGPVNPAVGSLQSSPNGPVWAYDNATEKFTIVPVAGEADTYLVTMNYVGSFHGFADPGVNGTNDPSQGYGQPLTSDGSVKGTITYKVVAQPNQLPDPSNLPGQSASDAHISDNIKALFDGRVALDVNSNPLISQIGDYSFSYQSGNYVQGSSITGDVTGH